MNTPRGRYPQSWPLLLFATLTSLIAPLCGLTGCRRSGDVSDGAQLLLSTSQLEAASTFELRFDTDVVGAAEIGRVATVTPLVVSPALRGTLTWQSRRSGIFRLDEPMQLGGSYRFTLRSGLKDAKGGAISARLVRTFAAPPFSAAANPAGYLDAANVPAVPAIRVVFNAAVRAVDIPVHLEYRRGELRIPATVQASSIGPGSDSIAPGVEYVSPSEMTWRERFTAMRHPGHAHQAQMSDSSLRNVFIVTPASPLPAGTNWELVVSRRLTAPETKSRLTADYRLPLGSVLPFEVSSVEASNEVNTGRRIVISFSKSLSPELVSTNVGQWILCQPVPDGFRFELNGSRLALRGNFRLGTNYAVRVRAGLPSSEPVVLAGNVDRSFTFEPISPRLYLPAFDLAQLPAGRRELDLMAVNAEVVRVRAKLLDRHTLIHALRAYGNYVRHYDEEAGGTVDGVSLDYNLVPGRTITEMLLSAHGEIDQSRRVPLAWDEMLGGRRTGAVFLAADFLDPEGNRATNGPRALLQLTDLGLSWKFSRDETLVWVFSQTTARPVAHVLVRLTTDENESLAEARTDDAGLVRLPHPAKATWLLAETDQDLHAQRLWENQLSTWAFHVPMDWTSDRPDRTSVMLFTDRGVYRPGETLQLKALGRVWKNSGWTLPEEREATLVGIDPRGEIFVETNLVFNARGSLDLALSLPDATRGSYRLELRRGEDQWQHEFQVRDFKPNAFQVTLDTKPVWAPGEEFVVPVKARYFLGRELARAKVHWTLAVEDIGFSSDGWEDFRFGNQVGWEDLGFANPRFVDTGDAEFREGTNLVLRTDLPTSGRIPSRRLAELQVEVTDLNQQTISAGGTYTLEAAEFYLGVRPSATLPRVGEPIRFGLAAVRTDGVPETGSISVTATLHRVDWHTIRVEEAGRVITYRNEAQLTNAVTFDLATRPAKKRGVRWGMADEEDLARTPPITEPGQYILELRAKDRSGNETATVLNLLVTGSERLAWNYRNEVQIDLVPDRPSYRAGEVAEVIVKTPINGTALVTIERERVLRSFVTNLVGNIPVLRIPLEAGDAPNVFVGLTLIRGQADSPKKFKMPEDRAGYCQLEVQRDEDRLEVQVRPDVGEFRPGQTVQVTALVRDFRALPVAGAEVSVFAVDEGIASLAGDAIPDPFGFFNQTRGLGVLTHNSLPNLLPEDPGELSFQNKGALIGGGGKESLKARTKFLPLAFWSAALLTDEAGEVRASFPAPDSLTRYRLVAVAHEGARRFGSGHDGFEVNKPLMIEPALPRFAKVGDRLTARAVIFNQTESPMELEATLELDSTARLTPPAPTDARWDPETKVPVNDSTRRRLSRPLTLAARAMTTFDVPVEFEDIGTASWTWSVRQTGTGRPLQDSAQSLLAVGWPAPLMREVRLIQAGHGITNLLSGADPRLLEGRGRMVVRISNSRLNELGECVNQLLHYPYGCVEQTSSSLLPWLVLRDSPLLKKPTAEADSAIRAGLKRLFSMQTDSGGLSYWPGSGEPQYWGSAYAGFVLTRARAQGVAVNEKRFDQLLAFLAAGLRGSGAPAPEQLAERCLALYTLALAGKPESAYHEVLFRQRDQLSPEDSAFLALAIARAQGPAGMIRSLLQPAATAKSRPGWFDSATRLAAVRLLAALVVDPDSPEVGRLVTDLLSQARNSHWGTTQANAWSLFALTEYATVVEQDAVGGVGGLEFAGQNAPFELPVRGSTFERELTFNAGQSPTLALRNHGLRPLFAQVVIEAQGAVRVPAAAVDRGFVLKRTYERLDVANKPQPPDHLHVGDRILVTLQFESPEHSSWVAIDDPLPAIFEAVSPGFKTDQVGGAALARDWVSDFHELRQDRALFFRNELPAGRHTIRYLARVRAAGRVAAPAAKIEMMYQPERFGLSETTRIDAELAN